MFVGTNLTNIRILHGYSRKQLSELLGITEQSIWQYENGYTSPKLEVVNQLKKIFRVKSKYFYSEDFLSKYIKTSIELSNIAYRADVINSLHKTQSEAKHVEYLNAFLNIIESKIHYPKMEILDLKEKVVKYLNQSTDTRDLEIKKVAKMARGFLELTNANNNYLMFQLEKKGIFIFEKEIGERIDAYSLWTKDDFPFIVLGNLKKSAARRNFDLAHELGHLLLHYKIEFTSLDSKAYKNCEKEANLFAGAFLLPEEEFTEDFNMIQKNSDPNSYIDMKKKWVVSIQAMAYRAHYLGLLDYQKYRYFNIKLNQYDYKINEPLDENLKIIRPGKVKSILQLLFENNYLPLSVLLEQEMRVDQEFLSQLLGIDNEFFDKFNDNDSKVYKVSELKLREN